MASNLDDETIRGRWPLATAIIILSGICVGFLIAPLIAQFQAGNLSFIALITALMILNVFKMVNAFIWGTRDMLSWPNGSFLCDIEVRLSAALIMVIGGAAVCISRDLLYAINMELKLKLFGEKQQWRTALVFLVGCLLVPSIRAGLLYIVSPERYCILPIHGCAMVLDHSWPTLALFSTWPAVVGIIAAYYQVLVLWYAAKYLREVSWIFGKTPGRNCDPKLRELFTFVQWANISYLSCLAFLPLTIVAEPFMPYSWARIHPVDFWTTSILKYDSYSVNTLTADIGLIVVSIVITLELALSMETRLVYKKAFRMIRHSMLGDLKKAVVGSRNKTSDALSPIHQAAYLTQLDRSESMLLQASGRESTERAHEFSTPGSTAQYHNAVTKAVELEPVNHKSQTRHNRFVELA